MPPQEEQKSVRFEEEQVTPIASGTATTPKTGMTASLSRSLKVSPSIASSLLALLATGMLVLGWYFYQKSKPTQEPLTPRQILQLEESLRPNNQR